MILHAFEIDSDGRGDNYWIITDGVAEVTKVEVDDFGDYLDTVRSMNYDVRINTLESWFANECVAPVEA